MPRQGSSSRSTTIPRPLSRRRLLRGAIAGVPVALGIPALEAMLNRNGDAYADGTPLPTRFGVWFYGAGAFNRWWPAELGPVRAMPNGFGALERHRSKVTFVSGLKFESFGDYATNRHHMGASSVLSGTRPKNDKPGGITIDQLVAGAWKGTPRASIEVSITDGGAISYNAVDSPNTPVRDPRVLMTRLFGGPAPADPAAQRRLLARRSYLDAVRGDIADLQRTLGAHDRVRLDSYLDGVAELEKAARAMPVPACTPAPGDVAGIDDTVLSRSQGWAAMNTAHAKLLAVAMGCGLSRVFTFNFSSPNSTPWFPIGVANNHHELGHQDHADMPRSVGYLMERFAELLDALAAMPEGDGTVLDRTGIIVLTEVSWNHHDTDLPVILAGGAGGKLKGGLHVKATGPSTRASFTLARAVGANLPSFGVSWAEANEAKVITDVLA